MIALYLALAAGFVDDLYGHRLLFDPEGRPVVPVGMMQGRDRVVVEAESGLVLTIGDDKIEIAPRTQVAIERVGGKAGVVRELWILDTLEHDDRAKKRAVVTTWKERGVDARALDVGGVYGVKGTVVDNRAALIVADKKVERALLEKHGARPALIEHLEALPSLDVAAAGKRASFVRLVGKAGPVLVHDVEHSIGYAEHGFADRILRGEVAIVPDKSGRIAVVNLVDQDALVAGVLPSEMFATAPLEALKAQAVTARGELFAKIGRRHFADPHLVCSEQHCQVYKGVLAEHPRANQAAEETKGELAFADGRLVDSVYSACCGGHTEAADVVWDRPPQSTLAGRADVPFADPATRPWLQPALESSALFVAPPKSEIPLDLRSDDAVRALLAAPRAATFCGRSSFNQKGDAYRWERRFSRIELDNLFADLHVGEVVRLSVEERGPGGRLRALRVEGKKGSARILRELPVRRRLGNLRSGLFVIEEDREPTGRLVSVTLKGAGFGHGSGMCQQGAIGMAEAGHTYKEILGHYYAGAEVRRVF